MDPVRDAAVEPERAAEIQQVREGRERRREEGDCRSSTDAGFTAVYNIVTGFEGDRIDDPGSEYHGMHLRNGWKNAGLPWCYEFHPDLMWIER